LDTAQAFNSLDGPLIVYRKIKKKSSIKKYLVTLIFLNK
jgi:hypothetical protein